MWEAIFYIVLLWEGGGGLLAFFLAVIGGVVGGVALHSVFGIVTVVTLITEVIVSVRGIVIRLDEGNGVGKSLIASILCVGFTAVLFLGLAELDPGMFLGAFLLFGPIWALCAVKPWFTVLQDGQGQWFPALIVCAGGYLALFLTVAIAG